MNKQPQSRARLIVAIVLLLLPVLYVGSYLTLLQRERFYASGAYGVQADVRIHYRQGGDIAKRIFWPLEQFDRQIRPGTWENRFPDD